MNGQIQTLIDRLKFARDELARPRARMHECTTEDLVFLIEDAIAELEKGLDMNSTKRKYMARYGLERFVTNNGHGIYTIEGVSRYTRGAENMFDAEGGVLNGNALFVGEDYGFGKITSIMVEDSGKKDYFKVRVEVES